jgi:hypothetical protein
VADEMLANKLLLETDERRFLATPTASVAVTRRHDVGQAQWTRGQARGPNTIGRGRRTSRSDVADPMSHWH